jgi:two-component system, LytTR family, response regulator LytT
MNTIIIEDESLAAERLQLLLHQYDDSIRVLKIIDSVEEATNWLKSNPAPDFMLLDIHLSDGYGFDIFKNHEVHSPVIFTTAYDQYALDAFKVLSVDYLLKPVTADLLAQALQKLKTLKGPSNIPINYQQLVQYMGQSAAAHKSRFLGKVGQKLFFIDSSDIAYFLADNKIVYLYSLDGNRYIVEHKLENLEQVLNPKEFFRVNRSMIVKAAAIDQVKPYLNSRLKIILKPGIQQDEVIVSRERVSDFKVWADS